MLTGGTRRSTAVSDSQPTVEVVAPNQMESFDYKTLTTGALGQINGGMPTTAEQMARSPPLERKPPVPPVSSRPPGRLVLHLAC